MPAPLAIFGRQAPSASLASASPTPSSHATQASAPSAPEPVSFTQNSAFMPVVVVGILVLLTVAGLFGYRAWRGRQMVAETQTSKLDAWYNGSDDNNVIERPTKAALAGDVHAQAEAGWVPQIRTWKGIQVQGAQLPSQSQVGLARSGSMEKKKNMELAFESPPHSPPPAYPSSRKPSPVTPLSPPRAMGFDDEDKPIPSPNRTTSMFAVQQQQAQVPDAFPEPAMTDALPLPRVMIVQDTFTPNMQDEISIVRGEAIRMLAEYKDGWCVVQRVGSYDSPKGVVPRSCLQERQEYSPSRRI